MAIRMYASTISGLVVVTTSRAYLLLSSLKISSMSHLALYIFAISSDQHSLLIVIQNDRRYL